MQHIALLLLAPAWLAVGVGFMSIIDEQGKLIGGSQYFAHFGMASGVFAQSLLAYSCFAVGAGLVAASLIDMRLRMPLRYMSLSVALIDALTYIGFLNIPVISLLGVVISLQRFPSGYSWVPISAFALSLVTAMTVSLGANDRRMKHGDPNVRNREP